MSEALPYMHQEEIESHPSTGIIKSKTLTVQGVTFAEVKKEFDKRWNK